MKLLGGNMKPIDFDTQISFLASQYEFVSLEEGLSRTKNQSIEKPIFTVTFDDGFKSVGAQALPILKKHKIKGAQAVNSAFMLGEDTFWRIKLTAILESSAIEQLKDFLVPFGYKKGQSILNFTLDHFDQKILDGIHQIYDERVSKETKTYIAGLFDPPQNINRLASEGWEICNHTKHHLPVTEASGIHLMKDEFEACQQDLKNNLNLTSRFWVIPFDRIDKRADELVNTFESIAPQDATLVFAGNKINRTENNDSRCLYRIAPPALTGKALIQYLGKIRYVSN